MDTSHGSYEPILKCPVKRDLTQDSLRRLVLPVKNNLGNDESGLAYRVEVGPNGYPYLDWEAEPVSVDINEALSGEPDELRTERDEAKDWLQVELSNGPVPSKRIKSLAAQAGHSWSTVKRAKKELCIEAHKSSFTGNWEWYLQDDLPVRRQVDQQDAQGAHTYSKDPFDDSWSSSEVPF